MLVALKLRHFGDRLLQSAGGGILAQLLVAHLGLGHGLAHPGIAHFKAGFGGREVRYVGGWDLVLDSLGRRVYDTAQAARVRWARSRAGLGPGAVTAPAAGAGTGTAEDG